MARKKRNELDLVRPAGGLLLGGIALGVGSSVVGSVGGATAANAQAGLGTFSSFLPVVGTGIGAGIVIGQLRNLEDTTKRKRRK